MPNTLPIHERFYSFQGEGCHTGRSAFFIRTYGCPVHCPWCDSAGTWHPEQKPKSLNRMHVTDLAKEAIAAQPAFVVITGGEPTIHDLSPLTEALHAANLPVHLETSGAFPIRGDFDWITLSPKRWKLPLEENLSYADEFKIIVDTPTAIEEYLDACSLPHGVPVWLHPEWNISEERPILNTITDWIKTHGDPFRAGWQLHKPYAADMQDHRALAE
ncbi:MAG: 7-carboxy-7-deazaguanine synthase QueE [Coraliomargaritaceae bacterium]